MTHFSIPGNQTGGWNSLDGSYELFHGPNLIAPFPAVVVHTRDPFTHPIEVSQAQHLLREWLPIHLHILARLSGQNMSFGEMVIELTRTLLSLPDRNDLPMTLTQADGDSICLAVGYFDSIASSSALNSALHITNAVFAQLGGAMVDIPVLLARIQPLLRLIMERQPKNVSRTLMDVAQQHGIPVYPLIPEADTWSYGQGKHAQQFFEAANHHDSLTGARICHHKQWSNQFVTKLGFPGVIHGIARHATQARKLAETIGMPLVVKPVRGGKGKGITVGLQEISQIDAAVERAAGVNHGEVLVERFVNGDSHRLVVSSGKLARASRLLPAQVIGDGDQTIQQLIDSANQRGNNLTPGHASHRIDIDADLQAYLARQRLDLSSIPAADQRVQLRDTAHFNLGGRLQDVTDRIHPDNAVMAESIAHSFHLDAAGIDFITPDITRSWRDIDCAVIEVNATPGTSETVAARVMDNKFPGEFDGRIPSILLLDAPTNWSQQVLQELEKHRLKIGFTSETDTRLGKQQRFTRQSALPHRVLALLLDPDCEALVVSCSRDAIRQYGIPHTRFDQVYIDPQQAPDNELLQLLKTHCVQVFAQTDAETDTDAQQRLFGEALATLVAGR